MVVDGMNLVQRVNGDQVTVIEVATTVLCLVLRETVIVTEKMCLTKTHKIAKRTYKE